MLRWDALAGSSWPAVAAVVDRVQREEAYHRRHAEALVARLGDGDAGPRLLDSFQRLVPIADALWEPVAGEQQALADGVVTAAVSAAAGPLAGRRRARSSARSTGTRSSALLSMAARPAASTSSPSTPRITEVLDLDPTARW